MKKTKSKSKKMAAVKPPATDSLEEPKVTYVASDNIWKAYCAKADLVTKNWPDTWGFMVEKVVKLTFIEINMTYKS